VRPLHRRGQRRISPLNREETKAQNGFDHDWLIVGSGFGGSVSALRLSEKGYRVAVLECGRRYRDEDYAASTWKLRRFMWAPALACAAFCV
jgi:cholesterol oxidase